MRNRKEKELIAKNNPELMLCENGDFKIRAELAEKYEIIDMHCHMFKGLSQLFPSFLQREINAPHVSLMDKSCFPFSIKMFDTDKISVTEYQSKLISKEGIVTRIKLFSGALVLNYATEERLISDMNANQIRKTVIQQINTQNRSCAEEMDRIIKNNDRLYTFGSVHPYDNDVNKRINEYMKLDIKGWKLNPHIWGVPIDCEKSIALLKKLAETELPIMSCSGTGLPEKTLMSSVPSNKTKKEVMTQQLGRFEKVLECIPNAKFILAHSGSFDFKYISDLMKKYPNTYTDISIQPSENIKKLICEIGSERILFGTDYPFVSQAFSILSVLRAANAEQERINIFNANAKKLLLI